MQDFETFKAIFPAHRLIQLDDELRYRFKNMQTAKAFDRMAQKVILKNGLRLVAELEEWSTKGFVFEICLVVKMAPEEHKVTA